MKYSQENPLLVSVLIHRTRLRSLNVLFQYSKMPSNVYSQEQFDISIDVININIFRLLPRNRLTLLGVNFFGFTKSREWIFF